MDNPLTILAIVAACIVALFVLFGLWFLSSFFRLWLQAFLTHAGVSIADIMGMFLRRVGNKPHHYKMITLSKIMATQAGLKIPTRELESHYLAGGNVPNVIRALIAADRADIPLTFKQATAIDLAGRNVLEAVQTSVLPKVIDCPDRTRGRFTADGVAKDGIQLRARARVTVRTNLERLIGGAKEDTVIARVGEGIVNTIGMADTYKDVLEAPERISKRVLERGLDSGTAFAILSIDIADVDVGDNVGAKLQGDQASADLRRARAEAEGERAKAIARQQEMQALVEEYRSTLVEAESQVPKAIADAIESGGLGIMDYYRLRNIQADTEMRASFAGTGNSGGYQNRNTQSDNTSSS
ncbi:SigmaW regulon antibacterial [Planctomycetes bacterium Pan216]|uniref:Flotillin-like protein FloA n=1 Tax=Kolteria novifilia TaxID=2527975 RepID=A0A518AYH5_9BACT|nr:SigmaW regulon antibacterial [Planctomycetes bacterium Pan216]